MMIPTPEPTEVNRLATEAIELRETEGITMLEAIETVCNLSLVPTTDKPLKIGNVKAYEHLLQTAVTDAVYARIHTKDVNEIAQQLLEYWEAKQGKSEANRANAKMFRKPVQ